MNYIIINNKINTSINKGIGINIPFNGNTGLNTTYTTKDSIRVNLLNFLLTGNRERILNPNFGSGIRNQLFELIENNLLNDIKNLIQYSIKENFPDIELEELNITPENNTVIIYIRYNIIRTNIEDDIQINFNNG